MRKKRWIAPVWGMLATAAFGQAASAQAPGSPLDGPFPPAGPPTVPPPGQYAGNPTYTPIAPDAASPAGYPPGGMRPWPTISPYENAFDQTYNQDGIWFREMLGQNRKYKLNVDFISGKFRQPGNVIVGHDIVKNTRDEFGVDDVVNGTTTFDVLPPSQGFVGVKQFYGRESYGRYYTTIGAAAVDAASGFPPV